MKLESAIVATLIYHDLFGYPLTQSEIEKYLIGKSVNRSSLRKSLADLVKSGRVIPSKSENFKEDIFALPKRQKIFKFRVSRGRASQEKFKRAKFFANLLKIFPSVKLVAITGALAMGNSDKDDDIDFLIVTSKNLLWTTRFLSNILLLPFKRDPKGLKITNRACLNLFLDESSLKIKDQNLYSAHEIAQMKILWDRDRTYQKLITANSWIKKYLPNWWALAVNSKWKMVNGKSKKVYSLLTTHYPVIEKLLRAFQLTYMRSKITTEKIGEHQLFFHPKETQNNVLKKYQNKLHKIS